MIPSVNRKLNIVELENKIGTTRPLSFWLLCLEIRWGSTRGAYFVMGARAIITSEAKMTIHTKLSKRLINPTIIIPSIFLFLTVISALNLTKSPSSTKVSATEDRKSVQASVTVPDTCYMSSTSTTHTDTVNGGTYTENFGGESTVTVTCNDRNGYSVYAVGYSNDVEGTNGLIGTSTGLVIPSGTSTSTNVSNWAMKLTPVAGTYAPTILCDTNGSFANYHVVPTTTTKVATLTSDINVSNSSQFKTSYAVAVAPSQAADTYIGKVKYTVVHPNGANSDGTVDSYSVTLGFTNADSIAIDGTTYSSSQTSITLNNGVHRISGTFPSGYEFSSWNSTGNITITDSASASTTINVTGTGTLTLTGQKQVVTFAQAYAAAGKTQTSGYYKMQDITGSICSSVTDGQSATLRDTRNGGTNYTVAKIGSICWMTQNLMLGSSSTIKLTSADSNVGSSGYTLPERGTKGTSVDGQYVWGNDTQCTDSSTTACAGYYSYAAATAGTNPSSGAASSDICPANWRLPTKAEFDTLIGTYTTGPALKKSPFLGVYAGWYDNSSFKGGGSGGYYWSSTAVSRYNAYYLNFGSRADVSFAGKNYGYAIRCVAKS